MFILEVFVCFPVSLAGFCLSVGLFFVAFEGRFRLIVPYRWKIGNWFSGICRMMRHMAVAYSDP